MPEITPKDQALKALQGLHLWHAPMSSCSQRVRLTLAETNRTYDSHIVRLELNEHATTAYQAIHPKGLVPALVDDGRVFIESIDIIRHLAKDIGGDEDLLTLADEAQEDLKLLTFEYLFRANPSAPTQTVEAFQAAHQNEWLKAFRRDFAQGFAPQRLEDGVMRTFAGFEELDARLSDGRAFLGGDAFSLSDIAWMPNVHRFQLMGWPFELTSHLAAWFERVAARPSYQTALVDWQPSELIARFATYAQTRRVAGTDIRYSSAFAQKRKLHA